MSDTKPWAFDESLQPREDEVGFDLAQDLQAITVRETQIKQDDVDALGDHAVDVGHLLGGGSGGGHGGGGRR